MFAQSHCSVEVPPSSKGAATGKTSVGPRPRPKSATVTATAVVLLAMMALLAGGAARRESVTVDEVAHVGAGVSYLQKLDLRMNEEHPSMAKVLAAVPLVLRGANADYSNPSWSFSRTFLYQYLGEWVFGHWFLTRWNDPYPTVFWARLPMLLLALALGFILYGYGKKQPGGRPALLVRLRHHARFSGFRPPWC